VGVDGYGRGNDLVPATMQTYQTVGTPQVAVIDKEGLLVFNHFGEFHVPTVEFLIERLLKVESETKPPKKPQIGRDAKLSGTYKMLFEQTASSCGEMIDPMHMNVKVDVITDFMEIRFPRDFMGISTLTARYNARTLKFNATTSEDRALQGTSVKSTASVMGHFVQGSRPPQITYNAMYRQNSDRKEFECHIKIRGTASRIGD
jgi:hypothetical protein